MLFLFLADFADLTDLFLRYLRYLRELSFSSKLGCALLVRFFSASTTFRRFKSLLSMLHVILILGTKITIY